MSEQIIKDIYPGEIFTGIITHVTGIRTFYLVKDEQKKEFEKIQELIKEVNLEESMMFWFPRINESFLFNSTEGFFRAIRKPISFENHYDPLKYMEIGFFDTGETFLIKLQEIFEEDVNIFYAMPEQLRDFPNLAIKCKWVLNSIDEIDDKFTFLRTKIYHKCTFEVIKIENDQIFVALYPYCTDKSSEDEDEDLILENKYTNSQGINRETLTTEQIEDFYQDPLNTNDGLIAVQGYHTRDDDQRCKFYDPKIGGCFKGGNCKQIHLPDLPDGLECRDRQESFIKNSKEMLLPALHSCHEIKITCFVSFDEFICQYINEQDLLELKDLKQKMNTESEIARYKKIDSVPGISQLIIAKYNDIFYRGRIIDNFNGIIYKILLLDEGKVVKIHIKNIYYWNIRFDEFTVSTVEMMMVGINAISSKMNEAQMEIFKIQNESGPLKAIIIENIPFIRCKLYDTKERDLSELLVQKGLAIAKEIPLTPINDNQMIPV